MPLELHGRSVVRPTGPGKGSPLEASTVRLIHRKIHATDYETCETTDGHIDRIERVL